MAGNKKKPAKKSARKSTPPKPTTSGDRLEKLADKWGGLLNRQISEIREIVADQSQAAAKRGTIFDNNAVLIRDLLGDACKQLRTLVDQQADAARIAREARAQAAQEKERDAHLGKQRESAVWQRQLAVDAMIAWRSAYLQLRADRIAILGKQVEGLEPIDHAPAARQAEQQLRNSGLKFPGCDFS